MIPLPLLERSAGLMKDDEAVRDMFAALVSYTKNPMLQAGQGLNLDPRVFNAGTFERVASRAAIIGDAELAQFMRDFAGQRRVLDEEQEHIDEAVRERRVLSFPAASELFRALGFTDDEQIKALRIQGYRLAQVLGQPAFALVKDSPLKLVE